MKAPSHATMVKCLLQQKQLFLRNLIRDDQCFTLMIYSQKFINKFLKKNSAVLKDTPLKEQSE